MNRMRIGHDWEFGFNETVVVNYEQQEVAVRRLFDGSWVAFSKYCPHQSADLSESEILDGALRCPWHGLCFELESGANVTNQCAPLDIYKIAVIRGEVFLTDSSSSESRGKTYLCRYGWDCRTGRFQSAAQTEFSAGDVCIGITARGVERVTILNESLSETDPIITGRLTGIYDSETVDTEAVSFEIKNHLEIEFREKQLDAEILKVELLLDNQVIVHYIGTKPELLGPISVSASHQLGLSISFCHVEFNA